MSTVAVKTPIALVVAVSRNGVIGVDNKLPWHLPGDLKHFKAVTLGKPVVMGRKTFESIGRPLPGRLNIVVTRDRNYLAANPVANGVTLAHSLEAALQLADSAAQAAGVAEIAVIGGADLYRQALPLAATVYLTRVELEVAGDACFPDLDPGRWRLAGSVRGEDSGVVYHLERYQSAAA